MRKLCCARDHFRFALAGEKKGYEEVSEENENKSRRDGQHRAHYDLEAERPAKSLLVSRAVKLRAENTGAGNGSEYTEIKYENEHARN